MEVKIQKFKDHNSCILDRREIKGLSSISKLGKELSKLYHHIIIENGNGWEEYENEKLVSWSFPNGCGMIKINS